MNRFRKVEQMREFKVMKKKKFSGFAFFLILLSFLYTSMGLWGEAFVVAFIAWQRLVIIQKNNAYVEILELMGIIKTWVERRNNENA